MPAPPLKLIRFSDIADGGQGCALRSFRYNAEPIDDASLFASGGCPYVRCAMKRWRVYNFWKFSFPSWQDGPTSRFRAPSGVMPLRPGRPAFPVVEYNSSLSFHELSSFQNLFSELCTFFTIDHSSKTLLTEISGSGTSTRKRAPYTHRVSSTSRFQAPSATSTRVGMLTVLDTQRWHDPATGNHLCAADNGREAMDEFLKVHECEQPTSFNFQLLQ